LSIRRLDHAPVHRYALPRVGEGPERREAMVVHRSLLRARVVRYTWSEWGQDLTTEGFRAPLEDWFGWILDAGFQLRAFKEPRPTDTALRTRPDLEDAARVPYYVVFDLVRP
jgi:hypothetical protein